VLAIESSTMLEERVMGGENKIMLTAFGETKCQIEWANDPRCIVSSSTISYRTRRGMSTEAALTTPRCMPLPRKTYVEDRAELRRRARVFKSLTNSGFCEHGFRLDLCPDCCEEEKKT